MPMKPPTHIELNPDDYIKDLEAMNPWSRCEDACDLCGDETFKALCRAQGANVCAGCAEKILRTMAEKAEIAAWHYNRIQKALSSSGKLRYRLTVLWRYSEAESLFAKQPSSDVANLRKLLVANLGLITGHPLDNVARQAAYEACVESGETILPFLLARKDVVKPWKRYANIVLSAGKIAPDNEEVRRLLEKAAEHPNPNVRGRVAAALMGRTSNWAQKMLERLKEDSNPRVREFIQLESKQMPLFKKPESPQTFKSTEAERIQALESDEGRAIVETVDRYYPKSVLQSIYRTYLARFYKPADFDLRGAFAVSRLSKARLVYAYAYVLATPDMLKTLIQSLPPGVQTVLNVLVWQGGEHLAQDFEKKRPLEPPVIVFKKEKRFGPNIKKVGYLNQAYQLFTYHSDYRYASGGLIYEYHLFLPRKLRALFKTLLPAPEGYHLSGWADAPAAAFVYEDNDRILSRIDLFQAYMEQGNLKYSKNGAKVLKTSIRQMAKYCDIEEFYDPKDKDLGVMRTTLIIDFLSYYGPKVDAESSAAGGLAFLKALFTRFINDKPDYTGYYVSALLWHLKGIHNLTSSYAAANSPRYEHAFRSALAKLLAKMPVQDDAYQWIEVGALIRYCLYREIDLGITELASAERYLSFDMDDDYGPRQMHISASIYTDAVTTPLVKGVLFLLAAFGLVDIAYDKPHNDVLRKKKLDYLSLFDGLRYFRLTKLGAYAAGLLETYQAKTTQPKAEIILDDQRLLIRLNGRDRVKTMLLERMAEKVTTNCYKVSFQSFLKECASERDIRAKIRLFKEELSSDPPPIWKAFLDDISAKIDPLSPQPDLHLFRLNDNRELITLMARDEVLKKYVLKAENFHVAIKTKDLLKVKKRLEEFGYFITQLR